MITWFWKYMLPGFLVRVGGALLILNAIERLGSYTHAASIVGIIAAVSYMLAVGAWGPDWITYTYPWRKMRE